MKEYKATLHGYKVVLPARCKLERLEPITDEVILPLHFAESAPVAMRVSGPLEYTGKDGNTYIWRNDPIELLALDGMLWRPYGSYRRGNEWRAGEWTIDKLADIIDEYHVLDRWPYQWRSNEEPPAGLLVRDRGTWSTIENQRAQLLDNCDRYASIGGNLYEPARELVYAYDNANTWGWGKRAEDRAGSVIVATEYEPGDSWRYHYLCNALQDWRKVNIYDEYTSDLQDKIFNKVTGIDVIEVFLPEYVKADPYGDFWRKEIESHKTKAANCKQAAKEHKERARALMEDAKADREAAARELETARKYTEKLNAYLSGSEA